MTTPCGGLHCQRNCYSRQLSTTVVSCVELSKSKDGGRPEYEVVLADTILFPEGGGQVRGSGRSPTLVNINFHIDLQGTRLCHL